MTHAPAEPRWGFRTIEERGLFDFGEAHAVCAEALLPFQDRDPRLRQFTYDFTMLSAAEYMLAPAFANPVETEFRLPLHEPIAVAPFAVLTALAKADCGWTDLHGIKANPDAVRPWDILLFAGDMAKAELLGVGDVHDPELVDKLVWGIESMHANSVAQQGHSIAERGLVRMQGVLWKTKLALQVDPDHLETYVDDYVEAYGLSDYASA